MFLKISQNSQERTCTGVSFQPATFNFTETRRRNIYTPVSFPKFFRNTLLLWKTSCEFVFKGFYEKWRTDILIIIKRYCEVDASLKKQTLQGKVYIWAPSTESWHLNLIVIFSSSTDVFFLVTKIFYILLFSGKNLGVF